MIKSVDSFFIFSQWKNLYVHLLVENLYYLVDQIEIIEAEPKQVFDESVIRCVSSWRFAPGEVRGEPVKTRVQTTIRFKLES